MTLPNMQAVAPVCLTLGRVRTPFWLRPTLLLILTLGLPAFATYSLPGDIFVSEWKCHKYFDQKEALTIIGTLGAFALGAFIVRLSRAYLRSIGYTAPPTAGVVRLDAALRWSLWFTAGLTLAGTAIWVFYAWRQGITLADVAGALHGQSTAVLRIRAKAETIPGVTTLTQFGMAAGILAGLLWFRPPLTGVRLTLGSVLGVALLRSILRAERLAFIEVLVPFLVALLPGLITRYEPRRWFRLALPLMPLAIVGGLAAFFIVAETGRSYDAKREEGQQSGALEYGSVRLVGYYGTSLNNGAYLAQHLPPSRFPYFSLDWFWRFPGVKSILNPRAITGIDDNRVMNLLTLDMNIEFNNVSGIFSYEHDFGRYGLLVVAFFTGAVSGWLFSRYREGTALGRLLYPMLVVGILEIARIPYLTSGRAFPSLAFLLVLCATSGLVRVDRNQGIKVAT